LRALGRLNRKDHETKESLMAKGQITKKQEKKAPEKTPKEKKQEKLDKKKNRDW